MDSITAQALVFIVSALILVPLSQRLRFGSVLGYLIAGVVVGPYGLKLIPNAESVMHFAELGVALLLFVIGLEIQPSKLWAMRRHLFGLGGLQIVLSSALFTAVGCYAGLAPSSALVLGFALSLSSTAYALQTLMERNEFNTEFGRSSFAILLMQDLVAIPALALIPLLAAQVPGEARLDPLHAAYSVAAIVALLGAGRFLMRPVFRMIAATRTRELFTATTLFIVLGVAVLMRKIGLSEALGTFVAGVLLADSEYRHEIEADLEPFKGLLMGLFFISVGMSVSLDTVITQPLLVVGLALGYWLLKALVIYLCGRSFRLGHEKSKKMLLTVSQGGEFAFVIFGMALQFRLADSNLINLLTLVITLSMAISPLLNLFNDRMEAWTCRKQAEPTYDTIPQQATEVIIAGFGRFGQVFARIMRAQNVPFVAVDHDSDTIEGARKFGWVVYYGDASRRDLLESAGAARAKYFILAIDDVEMSIATAKVVQEYFPNLKIFARARNRAHAYDLMALGIEQIKRETFDSAVYFVQDLLVDMGFAPARASEVVNKFKRHDEIMLKDQFKVRNDTQQLMSVARLGAAQLAQVLSQESTQSFIEAKPEHTGSAPGQTPPN